MSRGYGIPVCSHVIEAQRAVAPDLPGTGVEFDWIKLAQHLRA